MSKFKPGDKVTPINMDRYTDRNSDQRKEMLGRTLVVRSVHNDETTSAVFAGVPGDGCWEWHPNDLRLVSKPATAQKPKLLDRGDLVEYLGEVWIVTIGTVPTDIFAQISTMTGKERTRWVTAYDVTRVGSIRKKVKRIKKDMGDSK